MLVWLRRFSRQQKSWQLLKTGRAFLRLIFSKVYQQPLRPCPLKCRNIKMNFCKQSQAKCSENPASTCRLSRRLTSRLQARKKCSSIPPQQTGCTRRKKLRVHRGKYHYWLEKTSKKTLWRFWSLRDPNIPTLWENQLRKEEPTVLYRVWLRGARKLKCKAVCLVNHRTDWTLKHPLNCRKPFSLP